MKRTSIWISALLVLSLMLAACGPLADEGDDDAAPPQPEETPQETPVETPEVTPEEAVTPTPDDDGDAPTPGPDETPLPDDVGLFEQGEQIFLRECAACHGEDGEGAEQAGSVIPPHNQNSLVVADNPNPTISVILTGRGGMPRFADILSDEEIAAVVTYIRNAWDNEADEVDAQMVQDVRQEAGLDDEAEDEDPDRVEGDEDTEGDEVQGAEDQEDEEEETDD